MSQQKGAKGGLGRTPPKPAPYSQVGYYVGGCDHQWVPSESQYTGPVAMHCAKCGAIRA